MDAFDLFKNIGFIVILLIIIYFIFIYSYNLKNLQEGLQSSKKKDKSSEMGKEKQTQEQQQRQRQRQNYNLKVTNGITGNAASYAAAIKAQVSLLQDSLLISKYKNDYENVIINMNDLVNHLMLQTVLSIDHNNPINGLDVLVSLNETNNALNNVMSFLDSQ